jgi:hypothetical protein
VAFVSSKSLTRVTLIALVLMVTMLTIKSVLDYRVSSDIGQETWTCTQASQKVMPYKDDKTVITKTLACSGFGGSSNTYIFVLKKNELPNINNLVLKYYGDSQPEINWISSSEVEISASHVGGVARLLTYIAGITIAYHITPEPAFK